MIRAVYSFFAGSAPVRFRSGYGLLESVARLRSATISNVPADLSTEAAVGNVSETHVTIRRVVPLVGNAFKPVFVGRFEAGSRGVELVGRFTIRRRTKIFVTIWLGFMLAWTVIAVRAALATQGDWYFPLFGAGIFVAGVVICGVCQWLARSDPGWLSNVIQASLSAQRDS